MERHGHERGITHEFQHVAVTAEHLLDIVKHMQAPMILEFYHQRACRPPEQNRGASLDELRKKSLAVRAKSFSLQEPVEWMPARGAMRRMDKIKLSGTTRTQMAKAVIIAVPPFDQTATMHAGRWEDDVRQSLRKTAD